MQTKGKNNDTRLMFWDQHKSHISPEISDFGTDHNIEIIGLPPYCTHVLQALDVGCFGSGKTYFSTAKDEYWVKNNIAVTKDSFLEVYATVHTRMFTPKTIKNSFAKVGIYPFNPAAVSPALTEPSCAFSTQGTFPGLPESSPMKAVLPLVKRLRNQSHPPLSSMESDGVSIIGNGE